MPGHNKGEYRALVSEMSKFIKNVTFSSKQVTLSRKLEGREGAVGMNSNKKNQPVFIVKDLVLKGLI